MDLNVICAFREPSDMDPPVSAPAETLNEPVIVALQGCISGISLLEWWTSRVRNRQIIYAGAL